MSIITTVIGIGVVGTRDTIVRSNHRVMKYKPLKASRYFKSVQYQQYLQIANTDELETDTLSYVTYLQLTDDKLSGAKLLFEDVRWAEYKDYPKRAYIYEGYGTVEE